MKQQTARLSLLSIALGLSACTTTFQETKIDYKSAGKNQAPSLEVPPDLTQLSQDSRYTVPGGVVSAAAMQANAQAAKPTDNNTAANKIGDVRIERDGAEHWLVVDRGADKLWEPTRDFWLENGFIYAMEDRQLGILETDWAENRAKLPQDIIRRSLGKVFDSLYSTSERKDNTIWQPRPRDPELETEFLRRIMVKLGVSEEQASAVAKADRSAATTSTSARMDTVNGVPTLQLEEGFERAWRRVGVALDRTGFTVEDRDRSRGLYYVRYVDPNAKQESKGFFSKIFSQGKEAAAPQKYQIQVKGDGNKSQVSVLNEQGQPDSSANGQRIVRIITDDLK